MRKLLGFILIAILLGGCITLEDASVQDKLFATATLPASTCQVCPTCQALVPTIVTGTVIPTITPTSTNTPVPPTPTVIPATVTPPPTKTLTPTILPYKLQATNPTFTQNFNHPELACNWMGVAGQVFDKAGKPVAGIVVVIKGQLSTGTVNQVALTEQPAGLNYGPAGYEITLGDKPLVSSNALTIQLFDLNANALSKPVIFSTSALCTENLILINFVPTP